MLVLGHRGASGYAPENTFAAFDLARQMGADGVETDVRLTSDGVLVLLHDETVDRTTDGSGAVADLEWAAIQHLDAGSWYGREFAGQRVPKLADFLDRYLGAFGLCLEIKAMETVDPLLELLYARGAASEPTLMIISFIWDAVERVHCALPSLAVGYLVVGFPEETIHVVADSGLNAICPQASELTPERVARAHRRGIQVGVWGVATREDLQAVRASGADSLTLNWPDWG